ncbi:hypothetical protein [Sphingobacterium sp. MYb382]|uniref:hypothetical protein n=1 Tax=Sphingobacterium sp. MYb382 TaxID=2745278 RepID=UPI003097CFA8
MGFEYKLRTKLTENQLGEIQNLLASDLMFDKKYKYEGEEFWDYRKASNTGKLPNIHIIFMEDGIYICQYNSSYLWTDLDKLKSYIESNDIDYEIIDYQD